MRSEHSNTIKELARAEFIDRILSLAKTYNLDKISEYQFWSPDTNIKNHKFIWFQDKNQYESTNNFNLDAFVEDYEDIIYEISKEYNYEDFIATIHTNNPNENNKLFEIHIDW